MNGLAMPNSSPFVPARDSVARVMRTVLYALVPGVVLSVYWFGWGVAVNIVLAAIAALGFEALMLWWRGRPLRPFLLDGSALVTAVLLALTLPPLLPWWIPVVGSFFAIVMAKHLYGGLGYNPFNPAMAAYAILLISYPLELSLWIAPQPLLELPLDLSEVLRYVWTQQLPEPWSFDSLTMATPLDHVRSGLAAEQGMSSLLSAPVFGGVGGLGGEWISAGFALGGAWLWARGIVQWHIPVSMLASLLLLSGVAHWLAPADHLPPLLHLLVGGSVLGAFFIATDPVTAPATARARLIYGAGIGVLTFAIRAWGSYPDGVAFAVLLMGMCAPLLDRFTVPRAFGARRRHEDS